MGHAADFSNALLETGLVACEVVADQLAILWSEKVACMFACTTVAEVGDHRPEISEGRGAVGPHVSTVG